MRDEGRRTNDEVRGTKDEGRGTRDEGGRVNGEGRSTKDKVRRTWDVGKVIKFLNFVLLTVGYVISRLTGKVHHFGMPAALSIEPNNTCNLHCPECPTGINLLTRSRGHMKPALFRSVIDQLEPHLFYLTLYFQGEPYLNDHFFEYIAYARSKKVYVSSSTNGHFFDQDSVKKTVESGLNKLIISLDGFNQESYETYRKSGNFEKVTNGIRLLAEEKKRMKSRYPQIVLQCLVLRSNEHHLAEVRSLGKMVGVDRVEFKTAQFNDYRNGNPLMPLNDRFNRYRKLEPGKQTRNVKQDREFNQQVHRYEPKNPLYNACFRMWISCVITWDGKVVPCCFDKDANFQMGDLTQQAFREIWKGNSWFTFRKTILTGRKSIEMCCNCTQII